MSVAWSDEAKADLLQLSQSMAHQVELEAEALDGVAIYKRDRHPNTFLYVCANGKIIVSYSRVQHQVIILGLIFL